MLKKIAALLLLAAWATGVWGQGPPITLDKPIMLGEKKGTVRPFAKIADNTVHDFTAIILDADYNITNKLAVAADGQVLDTLPGFERPMHIATRDAALLVAEYGSDIIRVIHHGKNDTLDFSETFDALSGVDTEGSKTAVADFENSRLVVYDLEGNLKQVVSENLDRPTDALQIGDQLFIVNYHGRFLSIFKK